MYKYDETIGLGSAGWAKFPESSGNNQEVLSVGTGYSAFVREGVHVTDGHQRGAVPCVAVALTNVGRGNRRKVVNG